ncbi:unnamed protein product [Dovyalis caffra]|uniref:Uncharacterized protein n=1 Tax=Dovyalis caffra TaxID=77055 RepID=A0AAV1SIR9_9ROSI|nr:unnamed protein product [Dovyalis caffra]
MDRGIGERSGTNKGGEVTDGEAECLNVPGSIGTSNMAPPIGQVEPIAGELMPRRVASERLAYWYSFLPPTPLGRGVELGRFFYGGLHTLLLVLASVFTSGPAGRCLLLLVWLLVVSCLPLRALSPGQASLVDRSRLLLLVSVLRLGHASHCSSLALGKGSSHPMLVISKLGFFPSSRGLACPLLRFGEATSSSTSFDLAGNSTFRLMKFKNGLPTQRDSTLEHQPSSRDFNYRKPSSSSHSNSSSSPSLAWTTLIKGPDRLPLPLLL